MLPALEPGDVVSGRYRIVERLGEGGMGAVYRVEQTMMNAPMAMKVLRPEISNAEEMEKRFEREAKAAARLDSPHIVRANDFGRTPDGTLFLVMELIQGATLMERIKRGPIPLDEAIEIADQILIGLAHAHSHDVIHRDLKPGNIMLVQQGDRFTAKILDFGLAKLTSGDDSPLTQVGMVYGTARYMSPEQASCAPIDHRSDLYSVGVILFVMLTGRAPFEGTQSDIMRAHLLTPAPPLALGLDDADLENALENVVHTAMAKTPETRYQDATIFRAALAECRAGSEPTLVRKAARVETTEENSAPPSPAARSKSRFKLVLLGCAALAFALVARSFFVSWSNGREVENRLVRAHQAAQRGAWDDALLGYEAALSLDPEAVTDPRLGGDLKGMIEEDRTEGLRFVEMIAAKCDDSAAPALASAIGSDPRIDRAAYLGLEKLGETDSIDAVGFLIDGLENTRGSECEIRKWYVTRLGTFDDPRVQPALKKQLHKRGGFLFIRTDVNACMKEELDRLVEDE